MPHHDHVGDLQDLDGEFQRRTGRMRLRIGSTGRYEVGNIADDKELSWAGRKDHRWINPLDEFISGEVESGIEAHLIRGAIALDLGLLNQAEADFTWILDNHEQRERDLVIRNSDLHAFIKGANVVDTTGLLDALREQLEKLKRLRHSRMAEVQPPQKSRTENSSIQGSGFFVNEMGAVITNRHVVEPCTNVHLRSASGQTWDGTVVALSTDTDLAIIKSDSTGLKFLELADHAAPEGRQIIVYGFPLGGLLSSMGNVTTGIVSGLRGPGNRDDLLQISAPVQVGNSGGPVIDTRGQLVGVVVSKLDAAKVFDATNDFPQNVNFAVNLSKLKNFLYEESVAYHETDDKTEMGVEAVTELAKRATVEIVCRSN
jgi:S1-C subfamily serine protease